jgi:hypothetical protein
LYALNIIRLPKNKENDLSSLEGKISTITKLYNKKINNAECQTAKALYAKDLAQFLVELQAGPASYSKNLATILEYIPFARQLDLFTPN